MVTTADDELAASVRACCVARDDQRHLGSPRGHATTYDVVDVGYNYRIDEPRAALGLSRLQRLEDDIAKRRTLVRSYRERLAGIPGLELAWDETAVERSSHFAFPVLLADRDARDRFRDTLKADGVTDDLVPGAAHLHRASRPRARGRTSRRRGGRRTTLRAAAELDDGRRRRRARGRGGPQGPRRWALSRCHWSSSTCTCTATARRSFTPRAVPTARRRPGQPLPRVRAHPGCLAEAERGSLRSGAGDEPREPVIARSRRREVDGVHRIVGRPGSPHRLPPPAGGRRRGP